MTPNPPTKQPNILIVRDVMRRGSVLQTNGPIQRANQVAMMATEVFCRQNYPVIYKVGCEHTANHHGHPVGTTLYDQWSYRVDRSTKARHLREFRKMLHTMFSGRINREKRLKENRRTFGEDYC